MKAQEHFESKMHSLLASNIVRITNRQLFNNVRDAIQGAAN
jgi:hypothetical protein